MWAAVYARSTVRRRGPSSPADESPPSPVDESPPSPVDESPPSPAPGQEPADAPQGYSAGTWGPSGAVALIERDGRTWHEDTI